MKKPKIIILIHYLELGGVEISLIGLLQTLDPSKVDVDLFIYSHQGPLINFIPDWINVVPENKTYSMIEKPIREALKNKAYGLVMGRLFAKMRNSISNIGKRTSEDYSIFQYIGNSITPFLPKINPFK